MTDGTDTDGVLREPPTWTGPSADPNDEQFGDVVEPTTLDDADEYRAVLVGEPYDGAVIGRPGAAQGPAAIRESLAATKTHHVDAGPVEGVGDLGDVVLPDGDATVADVQEFVRRVADRVYDTGAFPVFLGGDNSLTFANAAPLLERGTLGAVSFDAHLDFREVRPDVGPTSGTPYRQLHEAGLDAFTVVGARDFETSGAYVEALDELGGDVRRPDEVAASPRDAQGAMDSLVDVDHVYVSVDVDVLDAAVAPGVSAATPGGLSTRELFALLFDVAADPRVAGFEVVECAPPLDEGGRTVDAAARAVAHFLAGRQAGGVGANDHTGEADDG